MTFDGCITHMINIEIDFKEKTVSQRDLNLLRFSHKNEKSEKFNREKKQTALLRLFWFQIRRMRRVSQNKQDPPTHYHCVL